MIGNAQFRRMHVLSACTIVLPVLDGPPLKGFSMVDLSQMKNLRGGTIYAAAMVAPTTVRTWDVKLGSSSGTGHPRYDVSDAVAVIMMRQLTNQNMMAAGPAAMIVNALRPTIAVEVERIAQNQRLAGRWTWEGGRFAVVVRRPENGKNTDYWLKVVDADQIGDLLIDRASGSTPTVISILRSINIAFLALQRELSITPFEGSGIDVLEGRND